MFSLTVPCFISHILVQASSGNETSLYYINNASMLYQAWMKNWGEPGGHTNIVKKLLWGLPQSQCKVEICQNIWHSSCHSPNIWHGSCHSCQMWKMWGCFEIPNLCLQCSHFPGGQRKMGRLPSCYYTYGLVDPSLSTKTHLQQVGPSSCRGSNSCCQ